MTQNDKENNIYYIKPYFFLWYYGDRDRGIVLGYVQKSFM